MNTLPKRIKHLRTLLGIPQGRFSTEIGMAASYIGAVERGEITPRPAVLHAICSRWGVRIEWLSDGVGAVFEDGIEASIAANKLDRAGLKLRIKAVRAKTGLSQAKFADSLGVKPYHIKAIEMGRTSASEQLLKYMADTYGANLDWLRTGRGEMECTNEVPVHDVISGYLSEHPDAETVLLQIMQMEESGDLSIWNAVLDFAKNRKGAS